MEFTRELLPFTPFPEDIHSTEGPKGKLVFREEDEKIKEFNPTKTKRLKTLPKRIWKKISPKGKKKFKGPSTEEKRAPDVEFVPPPARSLSEIKEALSQLDFFCVREGQIDEISDWYTREKPVLEELNEPTHIRFNEISDYFPRSLVYVPKGPKKGLYVLLKDKEVGLGAYNRATLALHLETGVLKVFRSAKQKHVLSTEIEANRLASKYPEHFASGVEVHYKGPWRSRKEQIENRGISKFKIEKEENVEKVGFLMDWMEEGTLLDKLRRGDFPPKTAAEKTEAIALLADIADHLALLHKMGLVHFDLKPDNIFLTKDGGGVLADFGLTTAVGKEMNRILGSPGYVDPQIVKKLPIKSNPASDIWSFGCIMALVLAGDQFVRMHNQKGAFQDESSMCSYLEKFTDGDSTYLELIKEECFPNREDKTDPQFIIDQCLQLNPDDRPSAAEVAKMLKELNNRRHSLKTSLSSSSR